MSDLENKLRGTGVYIIDNRRNGKIYVGSAAVAFHIRFRTHRSRLRLGNHPNKHLQSAWNKYGESAFDFGIIEVCCPEECLNKEQEWIDTLTPYKKEIGYNKSPTATGVRGLVWSEESRKKASLAKLGRKLSAESIRKRTLTVTGRKRSEEFKKKMSVASKKRGISEETRRKMWETKNTPEYKKKFSEKTTGKKRSLESLARMSAAQKKRCESPEVREELRKRAMGNKYRLGVKKCQLKTN